MKTLFIIGISLWFLLTLLKKMSQSQNATQTGEAAQTPGMGPPDGKRDTLARQVAANPDDPNLWAKLGAFIYAESIAQDLEPTSPPLAQADEHFRTAASLAPRDASILLDWAQWKARSVADYDDQRMSTYRTFVEPKLRKAASLDPANGEILYYHALLLLEVAENQHYLAGTFEDVDKKEYARLLQERDVLLWDALDLSHAAERKHHAKGNCLALRVRVFVALAEEREGGEEKYLVLEAKRVLDVLKRLEDKNLDIDLDEDEAYITSALEALRHETPIPVSRPAGGGRVAAAPLLDKAPEELDALVAEKPVDLTSVVVEKSPAAGRAAASGVRRVPLGGAAGPANAPDLPAMEDVFPASELNISGIDVADDGRLLVADTASTTPEQPAARSAPVAGTPGRATILAAAQPGASGRAAVPAPEQSTDAGRTAAFAPSADFRQAAAPAQSVDFSRAAAAMAPPMPTTSSATAQSAPQWEAPKYGIPDYARQKIDAAPPAPAPEQPSPDTTETEPIRASVGAHRPLSHRPISR